MIRPVPRPRAVAVLLVLSCRGGGLPAPAPAADASADATATVDAAGDATADAAAADIAPTPPLDSAVDLAADRLPDLAGDLAADLTPDLAAGPLVVSPPSHDFKPTAPNQSDFVTFTATNAGNSELAGPTITVTGADFSLGSNHCAGLTSLPAGTTCAFAVQFRPAFFGLKTGNVTVEDAGQTVTVPLTGLCQQVDRLLISPPAQSFSAAVGSTSAAATFTVLNAGLSPVSALSIAGIGPDADEFPMTSNGCHAALLPGDTCQFAVAFRPLSTGRKHAFAAVTTPGGLAVYADLEGTAVLADAGSP